MISDKPDQERVEEEVFIFPASFAQQRLWFIEQLLPGDSLYVIPLVFRLTGSLARSQLDQSIQAIVCRHEILRTTFDVVDGQLVQVIAPELQVPLRLADLRALPASTREDAALAQIWQEIEQPFHLAEGPLLRVGLWQLHDTEHLLLIALHHIIFDEWSSGVLIRELGQLYAALVEDKPAALPELPIQYADFAHWQREWLQGEVLNTQLRYWKQQLKDVPVLNLPGATSRSLVQGHRGASQLLELPQPLLDALEELSQQAGVTLFMTMLAAFQTLLHRYTGQTDIAIGSPIANRHRSELEGLIGFLVNSLVLRTNLAGDPTFRELLDRVQDITLAAYAYQDLPFEKLVEELQPVRSLGQNPLFQVVFALQNAPMEQLVLPGLVLSPVELETKTSRFDLELYVWKCADNFRQLWGKGWQQSDGLRGVVVYNTDVFDSTTIASLRHHFQTLLEGIVANPDTHLSALPLLTTGEQRELLQHWSSNQSSYPANACIHQLFEAQVRQRPTRRAVTFGDQQFTYQELNQGSNQLARYLQRLGIGAGTPVGICLERSAAAIAAMLAVLKAGGAYVPLDPSYPQQRLHFMLEDAGIAVVLTQADWADLFQTDRTTVICLEREWGEIAQESDENLSTGASQFCENTNEWEHLAPSFESSGQDAFESSGQDAFESSGQDAFESSGQDAFESSGQDAFESSGQDARTTNLQKRDAPNLSTPCSADREALPPGNQLAYIIYTSGSTGTPKGVMIPHRAVNRLVCETNYVQIEPNDRIAQVANLAFDAATFEVWGALLNGAELIGIERETTLSPTNFVTELQQQQISILFLTTALFNQTVSQIPAAFRSLKYLLFGGEMVNVDRVRSVLQQGKPQHLIHVYGPTENTTFSTWYEVQDVPENATTIPIGQVIANTQVYLLDANLNPVPAGVRGEIYLGGDGLARGYLNRPELTAERFISAEFPVLSAESKSSSNSKLKTHNSKLYKTGDRALYHLDGNLEFLGRTDHQIKIRGFRVELGEIETVVAQHPTVQAAVVVVREMESDSLRETLRDRQLIAYVVPKASAIPTGASQFCKNTSSGSILLPNLTDVGQDFTNVGQDFTNVGQDFTDVGKDFTNVGQDFTNVGQDFTNVGQDFTNVGKDFTNVGKDFTDVGQDFTNVGQDFTDVGQDFTNVGKDFTNVGKDFTDVGKDFTNVGQDFTDVGKDFTNVGQDFTGAGKDFTNVGQDFTDAGKDFTDVGKMPTLQIYKNGMLPIPTERELRAFLKTKLPAYMVPAAFVVLDTLPLTVNGKVDQKALPPPNLNVGRETSPAVAPTTSLEAALVELWTQLLGRKQVGIHDNFFELGGHSLLATQLVSRIRDRFQVELSLRSVFETPIIAELAQKIEALGWVAQADSSSWMNHWQESGSQRREEVEL